MVLPRRRDLDVGGLVDVGAARPRIEGRDEGGELSLQHVVVVPVLPLAGVKKICCTWHAAESHRQM